MSKLKFSITGAECSGKSTLSNSLALKLGVSYVPEYAITYLDNLTYSYTQDDLLKIALGQIELWEVNIDPILIADTDLVVIAIWSKVVFGHIDHKLCELIVSYRFDHYFLCSPDIPWEEGPHRVNPNDRDVLFSMYLDLLVTLDFPFTIVNGNTEERLKTVLEVISTINVN